MCIIRFPLLLVFGTLFLSMHVSCGPGWQGSYQEQLKRTAPPALHAVHDVRLRQIMHELAGLQFQSLPQEINARQNREQYYVELEDIARAMAKDAEQIPAILDGVELSEEHRKKFELLADRLRDESLELSAAAREKRGSAIEAAMERITESCNACHEAFRVLPRAFPGTFSDDEMPTGTRRASFDFSPEYESGQWGRMNPRPGSLKPGAT